MTFLNAKARGLCLDQSDNAKAHALHKEECNELQETLVSLLANLWVSKASRLASLC